MHLKRDFFFLEQVVKLLQEIGIDKIDKVTVMVDPSNIERNRGFAFLELETNKDAQLAYKKLQKKDIFGKHQNIKVAWAEPLNEPDEDEMLKVCLVRFLDCINGGLDIYGGLIFVCSWLLIILILELNKILFDLFLLEFYFSLSGLPLQLVFL